jgi:predicted nucleic acid-binding protein
LLVDDKEARRVAEERKIPCIGALGVLATAKDLGLVTALRPLFVKLLDADRYYSLPLINSILNSKNEKGLE